MSTLNPFDLLEDVESDDPSLLIAAQEKKLAAKKPSEPTPAPAAVKMPTKPLPPAQAVREGRNNSSAPARGSGRGGSGRGGAPRGGRGYGDRPTRDRDFSNTNGYTPRPDNSAIPENTNGIALGGEMAGEQEARAPRQPYRASHRSRSGGADEDGRPPRRMYDRHSGTGRGYGMKRDGAGRGNWGTSTDETPLDKEAEVNSEEKPVVEGQETEAPPADEAAGKDKEGDAPPKEAEEKEKEEEDKEMTLEEYEKVMEEKRKAFVKAEERKVEVDKELLGMQVLSLKKNNDEIFIKLGADKDNKKKETSEEKAKKSLSINEFLKPAEGERFYGRGRGGRGGRGRGGRGDYGGNGYGNRGPAAPAISDQSQFPTLGAK